MNVIEKLKRNRKDIANNKEVYTYELVSVDCHIHYRGIGFLIDLLGYGDNLTLYVENFDKETKYIKSQIIKFNIVDDLVKYLEFAIEDITTYSALRIYIYDELVEKSCISVSYQKDLVIYFEDQESVPVELYDNKLFKIRF